MKKNICSSPPKRSAELQDQLRDVLSTIRGTWPSPELLNQYDKLHRAVCQAKAEEGDLSN